MSVEIIVPNMGESVVEATVAQWLKAVGDAVKAGDDLVCPLNTSDAADE